jgi:hypothetical protein
MRYDHRLTGPTRHLATILQHLHEFGTSMHAGGTSAKAALASATPPGDGNFET